VNDKSQRHEPSQNTSNRFRAIRAIFIFLALAASFIAGFSHYRDTVPEAELRPPAPQEPATMQLEAQLISQPSAPASRETGRASWYAFDTRTANGEPMNADALTAAHRSLPFGTKVLVENLSNGRSVVVRINDRGPFTGDRIIDLSKAAADNLGMIDDGVATVRLSSLDEAPAAQITTEGGVRMAGLLASQQL
jgi:peptidoglycan lytic transglycosylase